MKLIYLAFPLLSLLTSSAEAAITRLEYRQSLRGAPDEASGRFEYTLRADGLETFRIYLERWVWRPEGCCGSILEYQDEIVVLENLPLEITHGPEAMEHDHLSLRKMRGQSPEGDLRLEGEVAGGSLELSSPRLSQYFPGMSKVRFKLDLGASKTVTGNFAPGIGSVEEKKTCWEAGEWNSAGCNEFTEATIFGNEVASLTSARGEVLYPQRNQHPDNPKRLRRQGFLRTRLPGHWKGQPIILRGADGRVLRETTL